ncbi:hypothetical protein PENTCL1PPCAC_19667 [Pristionchus entomophagus]|uniref:Uncharacterized protein n=1 Tax=Pristionchus entomophagus TaxID=358040 RepID=A0AAV5TTE7_9BILA|nr:hypothetical protein PENTCL1PPCAC_19667 [Pristionchus entomophagus]
METILLNCKSMSHLEGEHHGQELFVLYCDDTVTIVVLVSERSSERLEHYTELDEIVKVDVAGVRAVELVHEDGVEAGSQTVSKSRQGIGQLSLVDVPRAISVEAAEACGPVVHVVPQYLELSEVDSTVAIGIEHSYHQSARLGVERVVGAVGERPLQ